MHNYTRRAEAERSEKGEVLLRGGSALYDYDGLILGEQLCLSSAHRCSGS